MRVKFKDLYPDNWLEIREWVLARDDYTCQKCGGDWTDKTLVLTVHHWDHNRANNHGSNLVTLCQGCHLYQEKGSLRSFGILHNEYEAVKVGQLWLPGFQRSGSKTPVLSWLELGMPSSPGILDHARPDTARSLGLTFPTGTGLRSEHEDE